MQTFVLSHPRPDREGFEDQLDQSTSCNHVFGIWQDIRSFTDSSNHGKELLAQMVLIFHYDLQFSVLRPRVYLHVCPVWYSHIRITTSLDADSVVRCKPVEALWNPTLPGAKCWKPERQSDFSLFVGSKNFILQ